MDLELEMGGSNTKRKGNWITFPFVLGTMACLTLASAGWIANLIVYLIEEFNIKSIDAAQVANMVNAGINFFPLIGAIIADSFLGSFSVVAISCCISFLGTLLITLTSVLDALRPKPCQTGSSICQSPSTFQYALLYGDLILGCIGFGVSRFVLSTMGANQFDKQKDQATFFNWFFFELYFFAVIAFTGIVYVQDNVGWGVGFGICFVATFIGLVVFLAGNKFYIHDNPKGSPFTGLAQVVVASIRKIKMPTKVQNLYYQNHDTPYQHLPPQLTDTLRFFNKAAIETEGDIKPDGSIAKPWRLCTVQQVEDFKAFIKIFPIWSSSILVAVEVALVQGSLTVLQALSMDRRLGHFKIPAGSITVVALLSSSLSLTLIDRFFPFLWRKVMRKSPTPLFQLGIGHVITALAMAVAAVVERRRLGMNNDKQEMLAVWLFPQLILLGIGEAFYFPGQVALYYQEFPASLHSTATAISSLIVGIAFYLSTAVIDIIRAKTDWLADNIDEGRLDNVYWVLVVIGTINFGYFFCCAKFFKYKHNDEKTVPGNFTGSAH
ncbi:protein NRT1/ PTR FAMILY 2.6-like [Euphorbia lathyris]|uniref:protein NRT1/ PTR FAMILY 2.6-like n=1 Tax=Euphorbia lathyris TaxID=212925 RepID=UPI0033135892